MYTVYTGITFGIRHLGQVSRAIISTLLTKMPHFGHLDMLFSDCNVSLSIYSVSHASLQKD